LTISLYYEDPEGNDSVSATMPDTVTAPTRANANSRQFSGGKAAAPQVRSRGSFWPTADILASRLGIVDKIRRSGHVLPGRRDRAALRDETQ
jgi:hypothetical protein